jgi:flavin prenyltransferase
VDLDPWVTRWHDCKDFTAPMASGSSQFDAMLVLPCTMGTLAAVANGISGNLIHRAADVMLKEGKPLVLAVRETPLNRVHLQNMLKAQEAGAIIYPAMPSFYHRPADLTEMARAFAGRLCDRLGIPVEGMKRWGDQ